MYRIIATSSVAVVAVGALAVSANAQSLLVHGGGAVSETLGTLPAGCPSPDGPVARTFATGSGPPCSTLGFSTSFPFGGVAIHKLTGNVWASDGFEVTEYDVDGNTLSTYVAPTPSGAVSGLGWDTSGDVLWVTDHVSGIAMGVRPPASPTCGSLLQTIQPPFALPLLGSFATGITWDGTTNSLFVCYSGGAIANVLPGGGIGTFGTSIPTPCVLDSLAGISIDTAATPNAAAPVFTVVDRFGGFSYQDVQGNAAAPTIYQPDACGTLAVSEVDGCAFAAHGIRYGVGGTSDGSPAPTIRVRGNSLAPNPNFVVEISGAAPGSTALLYASNGGGMICPALIIAGLPVHFVPQPFLNPGFTTVDANGNGSIPAPIPGFLPAGTTVDGQWLTLSQNLLQVTGGVHMTIVKD